MRAAHPIEGTDGLTERQREVYALIFDGARQGIQPTIREIMRTIGVTSPNGVMCHLRALEKKGWLKSSSGGHSRARKLLRTPEGAPVVADRTADTPSEQWSVLFHSLRTGEVVYGPFATYGEADTFRVERCRASHGSFGRVTKLEAAVIPDDPDDPSPA